MPTLMTTTHINPLPIAMDMDIIILIIQAGATLATGIRPAIMTAIITLD